MFFTRFLLKRHPNFMDFQVPFFMLEGPRGPSAKKRLNRTRRNDIPVTEEHLADMRAKLENEFQVMRCLATPYLTKEQEEVWHRNHGHPEELKQKAIEEFEQTRMPGRAKTITGNLKRDRIRGNIGNMLHRHRTIEEQLDYLIRDKRFDG